MEKILIQVLLVEDQVPDALLVQRALQQDHTACFQVKVADSLGRALSMLREENFQIVLLDLGLTDTRGIETFKRYFKQSPNIPVIVLSGLDDEQLAIQAVQAGAQDYLVKGEVGWHSVGRAIRYAIERQQNRALLQAKDRRFRAMIEHSVDGILLVDGQGQVIYESPSSVQFLGASLAAQPYTCMWQYVFPGDVELRHETLDQIMRQPGVPVVCRLRARHQDASWRWLEVTITNQLDNPDVNAVVVNYRDITERKQSEEALVERQTLLEIMAGLAVTENLAEFLKLVHSAVGRVIDAENFFVALYDESTSLFEEVYAVDQYDGPFPPSRMEKSISAYVFRTGKPLRLTPPLFDALLASGEVELVGTRIGSWLGVPLATARGVIGVMVAQDYAHADRYSDHDAQFLVSVASQVALAVERRRAEAEVLLLNRRMELILNSAGVGIYGSDVNSRIIFTNHEMAHMIGRQDENLLGQNMHALCHATRPDGSPYPETECPLYKPLVEHKTFHGDDETFFRSDGSAFPIEYTSTPIREGSQVVGTVVVVKDITERVQAQRELQTRSLELSTLLQAGRELSGTIDLAEIYTILKKYISLWVPCEIIVVSSFSAETQLITCQYMNGLGGEADVSCFPPIPLEPEGQGAQSRVIRSGKSLLMPDYEAFYRTSHTRMYFDQGGNIAEEISAEANRVRSAIMVPLMLENQVAGVLQVLSFQLGAHTSEHLRFVETLVFRVNVAMSNALLFQRLQAELVERRSAEEQVRKLNTDLERRVAERTADLRRANAELEQIARSKDEFLANMSHELRTPLNAILTLSESLEEGVYGPLGSRQLRPLHTIAESGHHLLNLINDILDLSKIEAGKLTLQIASLDVAPLCQACLRMIAQQAGKKTLQVSLEVDPQVARIHADSRSLKQMLINLLSNAVKFTPPEGRIGLVVQGDTANNVARFTVWDTGIGIQPDQIARLFRPFVQIDGGLARQYEGTGLGLALVYRMAEMHNGSISLESMPGQGSRFTVSLPWSGSPEDHDSSLEMGQVPFLDRVLLVSALVEPTDVLEHYLEDLGAQVGVCSTLEVALERAAATHPDIIFLDAQLPGNAAARVLAGLRAAEFTQNIPIIWVSRAEDELAAPMDGVVERLVKPVSRLGLHMALRKALVSPESLSQAREPLAAYPPKPGLILLAEDNLTNQATFADNLASRGYRIMVANNGIEALALAREEHPTLILMDIQMPGMDGLEATRRIKADPTTRAIPIIALTALAMPGDRDRCFEAGVSAYLSKPVSLKLLFETVESFWTS